MKKADLIEVLVKHDEDSANGAGEEEAAIAMAIAEDELVGLDSPTNVAIEDDTEDGDVLEDENDDIGCAESLMDSLIDAEGRMETEGDTQPSGI